MIDVTPIMTTLIAVFAAIALRYFVPWIRSKTTGEQRQDLEAWVKIAVAAAQQIYYQSGGATRKQYVLDFLADKGFDVDDAAIDAAIEAAVLALHQGLEAAT